MNEIPAGYLRLIKYNPKTGYQLWQNPFGETVSWTDDRDRKEKGRVGNTR
tara:strand:- start:384 stop:533 length:150 start_codon:yes stop_codon:yes gene_type:complete